MSDAVGIGLVPFSPLKVAILVILHQVHMPRPGAWNRMLATVARRERDLRLSPACNKNRPCCKLHRQAKTFVVPERCGSGLYPKQGACRTVFRQKDRLAHADDRFRRSVKRLKSCSISKLAGHIDITGATDAEIESDIISRPAGLDYPE